jgi:putative tricarboxylic transport membrane protein
LPDARLLPLLAIIPGVVLAAAAVVQEALPLWRAGVLPPVGEETVGEMIQFGFLVLLVIGIWIIGFVPAVALYLLGVLLYKARMRPVSAVIYCAVLMASAYQLASMMLMHLPPGRLF